MCLTCNHVDARNGASKRVPDIYIYMHMHILLLTAVPLKAVVLVRTAPRVLWLVIMYAFTDSQELGLASAASILQAAICEVEGNRRTPSVSAAHVHNFMRKKCGFVVCHAACVQPSISDENQAFQ